MDCYDILLKSAKSLYDAGICSSLSEGIESIKKHTGFGDQAKIDQQYARLSWDEYFMSLAFLVSLRSPDSQTQHGAVIVDQSNKILSTGYNGFLPGAEDVCMPNTRPHKYQHIIHAEVNAVLSAAQNLQNCKIYITGLPCNECLKIVAKSGIKKIVVGDRKHAVQPGYFELQSLICASHEIEISKYLGKIAQLDSRSITSKEHENW